MSERGWRIARNGAGASLAAALTVLLLLSTLGEGGGSPTGLLAWHAGVALLLVWTLMRSRGSGEARAVPAGVAVCWALFLFLSAVGIARAPYTYAALLVALELAACTAVAYLAARVGSDLPGRIVWPLAGGAALQGAYAAYQALATETRPAGTFYVPNHLALWLVAVGLLLVGAARQASRRGRLLALACGVPALAGIVAAGSRGALIGLAAGGGWLLLASRHRIPPRGRRAVGIAVAVAAVLLVGGLAVRMAGHDPFRYQRLKIWRASATLLLENPWWGTGPGQFEAQSANQRFPDGDGPLRYDRAHTATHSDWLRLPVEFGAPAALAFLAAAGLAAAHLSRRRRLGGLPPGADGAVAALIAIATHAVVDNPSSWPAIYLLASVLWGSLLASGAAQELPRAVSRRDSSSLAWRLGLAALVVMVFLVGDLAPYRAWMEVRTLPRGRLDAEGLASLERAIRLNRIHPDYHLRMAEHRVSGNLDLTLSASARESAEQAVRLHPVGPRVQRGLARVEARSCAELLRTESCRDRVDAAFRRAESLSRYDPSIPLDRAIFLLDAGSPVAARRAAERALSLEPESVLPRLVLAEAWIESGSPGSIRRADELLRQAEGKAAQWVDWAHGSYAKLMLGLDPGNLERLQRKIAAISASGVPTHDAALRSTGGTARP